ncbi:MAG: hypothetical protein ONB55_22320 [candidate division KSB1 bacterium]|nr:hypothetical protein [candidate division KSB1 bacterium]
MSAPAQILLAGGVTVRITNQSIIDIGGYPCLARYILNASGAAERQTNTLGVNGISANQWIVPRSAAGANYEARATVTSGTLMSGTTGTWLALSTSRSWDVQAVAPGSVEATITVEIRFAPTSEVLTSASIYLYAEWTI